MSSSSLNPGEQPCSKRARLEMKKKSYFDTLSKPYLFTVGKLHANDPRALLTLYLLGETFSVAASRLASPFRTGFFASTKNHSDTQLSVFNLPTHWVLFKDLLKNAAGSIDEIIVDSDIPFGRFGIAFPKLKKLTVSALYEPGLEDDHTHWKV